MAYLDITTQVILSPVPCIQVTVSDSVADYNHGGSFPPGTPGVNRTNTDGTIEQVRAQATVDANGRSVWLDYEAPQQEQVTYQAGIRLLTGTPPVSSPAMLPDVGAWLIDPSNPAGSVPLAVSDTGFAGWTRASTVTATPIYGSALPYVVESSVRQAPTGDISVWLFSTADHDALTAVLATPGAKLFSWPHRFFPGYGQVRWAAVSSVQDTPQSPVDDKWIAQLSLQPSSRPAVVAASFSKSWEDLRGKTWDDLRGSTWDSL